MDKIQLLQSRKETLSQAGRKVRDDIAGLVDEKSFVELSAFSFSKSELYGEDAEGEGVVTGFATLDSFPFYIVAQNFDVSAGGLSKASCDKICKCLSLAEKNCVSVIYLLQSNGVQVSDGVPVLEGLASVLSHAARLRECVTQHVIVNGKILGAETVVAAIADFAYFTEESVLAVSSPFVLSAKAGKNVSAKEIAGVEALDRTDIPSFVVSGLAEAREKIIAVSSLLNLQDQEVPDAVLNDSCPALNEAVTVDGLKGIFETYVEVGASYCTDVKTVLGRIGGYALAAVIFDGGDEGVTLTEEKAKKLRGFAEAALWQHLPFVVFADCAGICPEASVNNSAVLREVAAYIGALNTMTAPKLSVVYRKAVGFGYSLFAAKSIGFDYVCAFANARIALFDSVQGAEITFGKSDAESVRKYAEENSDPINAARNGYIDAIIEPQFVKQHLVSALQMLEM